MHKKYFITMLISVTIMSSLNAQTTNGHVERAIKDPKAKENAAKADVYIAERSAKSIEGINPKKDNKAAVKQRKKKSGCRKK